MNCCVAIIVYSLLGSSDERSFHRRQWWDPWINNTKSTLLWCVVERHTREMLFGWLITSSEWVIACGRLGPLHFDLESFVWPFLPSLNLLPFFFFGGIKMTLLFSLVRLAPNLTSDSSLCVIGFLAHFHSQRKADNHSNCNHHLLEKSVLLYTESEKRAKMMINFMSIRGCHLTGRYNLFNWTFTQPYSVRIRTMMMCAENGSHGTMLVRWMVKDGEWERDFALGNVKKTSASAEWEFEFSVQLKLHEIFPVQCVMNFLWQLSSLYELDCERMLSTPQFQSQQYAKLRLWFFIRLLSRWIRTSCWWEGWNSNSKLNLEQIFNWLFFLTHQVKSKFSRWWFKKILTSSDSILIRCANNEGRVEFSLETVRPSPDVLGTRNPKNESSPMWNQTRSYEDDDDDWKLLNHISRVK